LDDKTLEKLIRNQRLDGETSLNLARIFKIDENGIYPKIEFDGDTGRRQHIRVQTIQ